MTTLYVAAYASATAVSGDGGVRPYAVPAVSGDTVTGGVLIAYDSALTKDQLRAAIRKAAQFVTGLPL